MWWVRSIFCCFEDSNIKSSQGSKSSEFLYQLIMHLAAEFNMVYVIMEGKTSYYNSLLILSKVTFFIFFVFVLASRIWRTEP